MFKIGDKVKVVASKDLKKWLDKKGRDCVGKVCTVTSMGQDPADKRRVVYCLNDNQYGINFPASSLKKTTAPLSKTVEKVDKPEEDVKKEGLDEFLKVLDEVTKDVEQAEQEEKKEDKSDDLKDMLFAAVAAQTLTLSCKVRKLAKSDKYLGYAVWAIVAYLVFDVVLRFIVR